MYIYSHKQLHFLKLIPHFESFTWTIYSFAVKWHSYIDLPEWRGKDSGVWPLPLPPCPSSQHTWKTLAPQYIWGLRPQRDPPSLQRVWLYEERALLNTDIFVLDYSFAREARGGGGNMEVLALNISGILKTQMKIWKYMEVVSYLRKSSYMQKCHINSK